MSWKKVRVQRILEINGKVNEESIIAHRSNSLAWKHITGFNWFTKRNETLKVVSSSFGSWTYHSFNQLLFSKDKNVLRSRSYWCPIILDYHLSNLCECDQRKSPNRPDNCSQRRPYPPWGHLFIIFSITISLLVNYVKYCFYSSSSSLNRSQMEKD